MDHNFCFMRFAYEKKKKNIYNQISWTTSTPYSLSGDWISMQVSTFLFMVLAKRYDCFIGRKN